VRKFPYITVGQILAELKEEGVTISRVTFYRLEDRLTFPSGKRTTSSLPWRIYTKEEKETIKQKIRTEYGFVHTPTHS